ncbi:hypothetical protein PTKIN_Ptkin04bG0026600 [Pterospermum kingtungense]
MYFSYILYALYEYLIRLRCHSHGAFELKHLVVDIMHSLHMLDYCLPFTFCLDHFWIADKCDRSGKSFGGNQVWAAYDDDDGMPRFYAMIHVGFSGLENRKSIGVFNSFSHKVKWSKGRKGAIQIHPPKKGDVWALYRNWSFEWNALTANEEIHKYDMVEVLEDYNEQQDAV